MSEMIEKLILDEYKIIWASKFEFAMIGYIHHIVFNEYGGCLQTPVGHFSIHYVAFPGHWKAELFLTRNTRYDQKSRTTTVIANPERQAGDNKEFLNYLLTLQNSALPCHHPLLIKSFSNYLLSEKICTEPLLINIYEGINSDFFLVGELEDDDD